MCRERLPVFRGGNGTFLGAGQKSDASGPSSGRIRSIHRKERRMDKGILQIVLGANPAGDQEYSLRIDAKSAVLLDAFSNQVIFEQNPQERIGPASHSKMMKKENAT
jgi:D-alanyl-D-alanine carboxypeptidase